MNCILITAALNRCFVKTSKMWPMFVDYSDDECKRVLRSLELEAYASIVNAFRAQGTLTKERKKMLQELCSVLSIPMERHRAEIRRAVNDEHLNTIAERLFGPNTSTEWAIEGRRLVPLMPRLAPQTVFTAIANSAANAQAAKNATLPLPGKTGSRDNKYSNGIETMASRKRKDPPTDTATPPQKLGAIDSQNISTLCPFETSNSLLPENPQTFVTSSSETSPVSDSVSQVTSLSDYTPAKTMSSLVSCISPSVSPLKTTTPKHIMLKSTSTVTTFSSFDQLASNLLASRPAPQSPVPSVAHEEQISTVSETAKTSCELKNTQRLSPSICAMKSPVLPTQATSSCTSSVSTDRTSLSGSTISSQNNKFLTQIRPKTPSHNRQNLTSGLGLKLGSQPQMSQRALSPKSPGLKVKPDNTTSFFPKKPPSTVFSSPSLSDSQTSQFPLPAASESLAASKSSITITKSNSKSESQTVSNPTTTTKLATVPKSFQKTSTHGSQYMARSLFSSASKSGAKSLPPVIFNVSSTSCTPLQTSTKTTGPVQSEAGKITPQLLPKSTAVGIGHSHLKLNTSNTQTIQYRNDGGMVRSARIVNISQPVGSRLPCAISPSTISALGLASNLTSTALRVTLPAGTLNTSSSMRVSPAAKPNVIVVHKAQMWPRTQQGAAVIMSSAATLPKLSNDVETVPFSQKQEKSRPSGTKLAPRPIVPARPQSPAVSATALKISESGLIASPFTSKTSQIDSPVCVDSMNVKAIENPSETQCKKNLLADIIEASGILSDRSSPDKSSKEKNIESTDDKELSHHQELDAKSLQKSNITSSSDVTPVTTEEMNVSKMGSAVETSENIPLLSIPDVEKSGIDNTSQGTLQVEPIEIQIEEPCSILISPSPTSTESVTSSSDQTQMETPKSKNL